jgi:hypothetical protein
MEMDTTTSIIEKLGGRKFVGFIFLCVLFTILILAGKLDGQEFVVFITLNFGVYVTGNTVTHINNNG